MVFISYSHQDRRWLDRLNTKLAPLVRTGAMEFWWDGEIKAGERWQEEIDRAMASARVAVLLVSDHFLASEFIAEVELPYFLAAARRQAVKLLWVLISSCLHEYTPLVAIQAAHDPSRPLSALSKPERDAVLKAICQKIREASGTEIRPSTDGLPSPASSVDLCRLPIIGPEFVGREDELARLDSAWEDAKTHIVTLVAFGGVGKSALVSRWLDLRAAAGWLGVVRVLDWSFHNRTSEELVTSSDRFLDHALRFFGDPDPTTGLPWDRGLRLAGLVRREKTLLVLDGIEPLQHPPGPMAGQLKDSGLAALLKGLAAANSGLCLVTTRERIADLNNFTNTAPQWVLEPFTRDTGAELLRRLQVQGTDSDLQTASVELSGHALALTLLGNYLHRACGGEVRRRKEVDLGKADERQGGHAFRILQAYALWLGEGLELAILRLLGFFDRPAEFQALAALREKPPIPGLTETLVNLPDEGWNWGITSLQELGLLLPVDPHQTGALNTHSLVRAYFREELEKRLPGAWMEGNLRLYAAGFHRRALDGLVETIQPMLAGLEAFIAKEDWRNAAGQACNLSDLTLTLGEVPRAVAFGEQSVELAERSGDAFWQMASRAKLADALHQAGEWKDSAEAFREAETMQAEGQPRYPRLYSLQGYEYCDLLLSRATPEGGAGLAEDPEPARRFREACGEVRERANEALGIVLRDSKNLLDIALNHLSLGRANLGLAVTPHAPQNPGEETEAELAQSAEHFDRAVEGLRQSGREDCLPWALLARAAFRRLQDDALVDSKSDLDEALEIAERGSMLLHACDAHLEWARLCLKQGDAEATRRHLATARKIVAETGYRRREREVEWLENACLDRAKKEKMT